MFVEYIFYDSEVVYKVSINAYIYSWKKSIIYIRHTANQMVGAAAVYMVRVTSRKLHCDIMNTRYSWRHSKFLSYNFQASGKFLSPQRLSCWVSPQLEWFF